MTDVGLSVTQGECEFPGCTDRAIGAVPVGDCPMVYVCEQHVQMINEREQRRVEAVLARNRRLR